MMSEWKIVKIGEFLKVRQGKYKPNDEAILNLKRLNKIDFNGNIHLSEKPTKTDMIIVESGDLVISGINVAKGAVAIYQGENPISATIHYSSYEFDKSIIDIEFFKRFLKSPAFISALKDQVKGGIKTEIKAKTLLSIVIKLPVLSEQQAINRHFKKFENEIFELNSEISNQQSYLTKLRQALLQEAIEGKFTADWRTKNPAIIGNPDHDANALLEKIKTEKQRLITEGKIKKEKPLPPIKPNEIPFNLPQGWVWVRLGEIATNFDYGSSSKSLNNGRVPVLRMGNIKNGGIDWNDLVYTNDDNEIYKYSLIKFDLLFNRTNSRELVGKTALFNSDKIAIHAGYLVRFRMISVSPFFTNHLMNSDFHREWCNQVKTDAIGQSNINATKLKDFLFPLPPLAEQQAIVERVERLLNQVNALEQQTKQRKTHAEQLMQAVLKEAFTG
mgnify:CR=1 FL=1